MTSKEFRDLGHGDKIAMEDGRNYVVHNNHKSKGGMVVVVRTEVIYSRDCVLWTVSKRHKPVKVSLADGVYEVQVMRRID